MKEWDFQGGMRKSPWNDRPAAGRKDDNDILSESLQGIAHRDGCPATRTGQMSGSHVFFFGECLSRLHRLLCAHRSYLSLTFPEMPNVKAQRSNQPFDSPA